MVIGAGPIIIGQACEFDYSGSQGVKALKEEGYTVVLVNSNPATIMTDPGLADQTYIEPIEHDTLAAIVRKERPCAILPTLGGQTALNAALSLAKSGVLEECGVELIGANAATIEKAESRDLFRQAMQKLGLKVPESGIARKMDDVRELGTKLPFPLILRPAFTLGGTGGGIAYNMEDLEEIAARGLAASPVSEIMIEQSVLGWKEIEMEVVRDRNDNCIIVCSVENIDPMGVHTGDSITVAPVQTLTDREYQVIRTASIAIVREIGVETGGANIQFAVNPQNGELVVIEMNPRVSRSSALASKATGFPIAKIAAKLAVGYTLDELRNDITRTTSACFEPSIDYCVIKIPRFAFEKFPGAKDELGTAMKSVGEAMSIGRTFKEALQKGLRSMEIGVLGLGLNYRGKLPEKEEILKSLRRPNSRRIFSVRHALLAGMSVEEICRVSSFDKWFVEQIEDMVAMESRIRDFGLANDMTPANKELANVLRKAKEYGFSDRQLAAMWKRPEDDIFRLRRELDVIPSYAEVDTCAAEFEAHTPYYYSTYETGLTELEAEASKSSQESCGSAPAEKTANLAGKRKVIILGGGPNRIGQGIEFDYCCCHASYALRDEGLISVMVNSNPETVSTDYDTSDRLYFEPLTFEDVMHIVDKEKPDGMIVQFGGQTPLNLARALLRAGAPIIGTSPDAIDRAEDRERFQALLQKLGLKQPQNATAASRDEAMILAGEIGYPLVVRPSYVLGGRAMAIVHDDEELKDYFKSNLDSFQDGHPILLDKFLQQAVEIDVDAISDGEDVYIAGIMEHIEEAGIHSGDSACALPSYSLSYDHIAEIARQTEELARELRVVGLMNIQFAVKDDEVYILEVNPRASRTVPFVSKATGVPLAYMATQVMLGKKLEQLDPWAKRRDSFFCVKEAVLPFNRFPGVDILLGPEMRSTGEVMGMGTTFEEAFYKSQLAAGQRLPHSGKVFISVKDSDKELMRETAESFARQGFKLLATGGTAEALRKDGLEVETVLKVYEGRPNIVDHIKNGEVALIVNTASGRRTKEDSREIRRSALLFNVPYCTTLAAARASARAIAGVNGGKSAQVKSLQEYYAKV